MDYIFKSKRLGFREWKESDYPDFIAMGKDEDVMKYFPKLSTEEESIGFISKIETMLEVDGFGLYATDRLDTSQFIGFIGFWHPSIELVVSPFIEIGWRLKKEHWNLGFATEGASRCLEYGFDKLDFKEVYSMTSTINLPSERVMQKIGIMKHSEFIIQRLVQIVY